MPDNSVYTDDVSYKTVKMDYTRLHSYTNAKKAQELVWLEPYTDPISGVNCIGMSIPLLDNQSTPSGVLVGSISLKTFESLLVNVKYMPYGEMFVINPSGYIKFHSGGVYSETVNVNDEGFILNPIAESLLGIDEGYMEFSYLGGDWTCNFSVINSNGWKILTLMDTNQLQGTFSTLNKDINTIIISLGIISLLPLFRHYFLS